MIIDDYFRDRRVICIPDAEKDYTVQARVPQWSLLGLLLWNIMYDRVVRPQLSVGCTTVGFADESDIVVVSKFVGRMEKKANMTI